MGFPLPHVACSGTRVRCQTQLATTCNVAAHHPPAFNYLQRNPQRSSAVVQARSSPIARYQPAHSTPHQLRSVLGATCCLSRRVSIPTHHSLLVTPGAPAHLQYVVSTDRLPSPPIAIVLTHCSVHTRSHVIRLEGYRSRDDCPSITLHSQATVSLHRPCSSSRLVRNHPTATSHQSVLSIVPSTQRPAHRPLSCETRMGFPIPDHHSLFAPIRSRP